MGGLWVRDPHETRNPKTHPGVCLGRQSVGWVISTHEVTNFTYFGFPHLETTPLVGQESPVSAEQPKPPSFYLETKRTHPPHPPPRFGILGEAKRTTRHVSGGRCLFAFPLCQGEVPSDERVRGPSCRGCGQNTKRKSEEVWFQASLKSPTRKLEVID